MKESFHDEGQVLEQIRGLHMKTGLGNLITRRIFSDCSHRVQKGTGAHPAYYLVGTGDPFPGSKAAGA
jgi:hypothetical protein